MLRMGSGVVVRGREVPRAAIAVVAAAVVVSAVVGVAAVVVIVVVRPTTSGWWLWRAMIGGGHTWRTVPYTRWGHNLKQ